MREIRIELPDDGKFLERFEWIKEAVSEVTPEDVDWWMWEVEE
jgi:hypothetical protein